MFEFFFFFHIGMFGKLVGEWLVVRHEALRVLQLCSHSPQTQRLSMLRDSKAVDLMEISYKIHSNSELFYYDAPGEASSLTLRGAV